MNHEYVLVNGNVVLKSNCVLVNGLWQIDLSRGPMVNPTWAYADRK